MARAERLRPKRRYVIEFRFPEGGTMYAGLHQGSLGWASSPASALVYDSAEKAGRIAANGYRAMAEHAHIMEWRENGDLVEVEL